MVLRSTALGRLLAALGLAAAAFGAAAKKTQLIVYTALETDQLKAYQAALQQGRTRPSRSSGCATPPA